MSVLTIIKSATIGSTALELDRDNMADCLVNELDWDSDSAHLGSLSLMCVSEGPWSANV